MIAVIAALPREIAKLVAGTKPNSALRKEGIWLYRLPTAVLVAAGMGSERVTRAVQAARQAAEVDTLVSVGLAGSCREWLKPGWVAEVSSVINVNTGERFACNHVRGELTLASTDTIATVAEKRRLWETYGAEAVDMEAATVGRLARAHGLKFRAVKGISDGPEFELVGLSEFAGKHGEFRTAAFALHTALRPWTWGRAMELGKHSGAALTGMTERVRSLIAQS